MTSELHSQSISKLHLLFTAQTHTFTYPC